jgi:hypothetical protein
MQGCSVVLSDLGESFVCVCALGCEENLGRFDEAVKRIGKAGAATHEPKAGGKRRPEPE